MSRFDRALGLLRSLAIYHAIPMRQRRLRALYSQFVGPGDLVFDIGAHVGNRVRAFASLGCRVVAVEPQPDFAGVLRTLFARSARIEIVEAAVGDAPGRASLSVSDRTPTVTTLAPAWRDARARDPDFARVRWNRRVEDETTTVDLLMARRGRGRARRARRPHAGGAGVVVRVSAPRARSRAAVPRPSRHAWPVSLQLVGGRVVPPRRDRVAR